MSKTIPQLDPATTLILTNKIEVSQSDSSSSESVYGTLQQVLNVIQPSLELTPTQIDGTAITHLDTSDVLPQGTENIYLSVDGKSTDNLVGCPNFDEIKNDVDSLETSVLGLQTDVTNLQTEVDSLSNEVKSLGDDVSDLTIQLDNHIDDLANPHQTSLQKAYNQSPLINFNGTGEIIYTDSSGLQVNQFSYLGSLMHPIISHVFGDFSLIDSSMDYMYENKSAVASCTLTIQEESSAPYANNATFFVWRTGNQALNVNCDSGVTINGATAHTINIAPNAQVKFSRMDVNTWISNVISLSAGSGTDISEGGDISLDGTGASAGYGYMSGSGQTVPISFSDEFSYYIPMFNDADLADMNNFQVSAGGSFRFGIKYNGDEDCVAQITFLCMVSYSSTNTNPNPNYYSFCANLNLQSLSPGYMPINPIFSGTQSKTDVPFIVYPGKPTPVLLTFQIPLTNGDAIYPLIRNDGPSTTPSDNSIYVPRYNIAAIKIGDVGGATAGVTSLNGSTGNIDLKSTDSTLSFTPSGPDIDISVNTLNAAKINFNTVNLKDSSNALNTVQDINTFSAPEFARVSVGTNVSPSLVTSLTLSNSNQQTCRTVLAGQEFYQSSNSSTEGIAFLIGVNRSNNRQFWIGDSSRLIQNSTNPIMRLIINSSPVVIDSTATDGSTALPITFGQSGAQTTIAGSSVNLPTLTASSVVYADSSKNLSSSSSSRIYGFGISNPAQGANVDTGINIMSSAASIGSQLSVSNSDMSRFITLWSSDSGATSPALIWPSSIDFRFATTTAGSLTRTGFTELFRISSGSGDFINQLGNLVIGTAGKTLKIKGGTNGCIFTGATMVAGTVTINNSSVATGDIILITKTGSGGTLGTGMPTVTISNGISVTLTSSSALETSTFSGVIVKAA